MYKYLNEDTEAHQPPTHQPTAPQNEKYKIKSI